MHSLVNNVKMLKRPIKGLLLDISGVLKDGDIPIPGSVEALKKIQSMKLPFRLVTNETLKPQATIKNTLQSLGYNITEKDMLCPVPFLKEILKKENLRPHLLLHPRMLTEFEGIDLNNPNCVVIGDAEEHFNFETLNQCFRKLIELKNPIFFTLGIGKYYLDDDGLSLDVGPYCKSLEYATGITAKIIGKPSPEYFLKAVNDLGLKPEEVAMVGDDIETDVGGAQKCGMQGILVKTGKYRPSDEKHAQIKPDLIVDNLKHLVDNVIFKGRL